MTQETSSGNAVESVFKAGNAAIDVSSATTKEIRFQKEDGTPITKTAVFSSDGTDGAIRYQVEAAFHALAGADPELWRYQGHVILPGSPAQDLYTEWRRYLIKKDL
jgi:hypothetical protein